MILQVEPCKSGRSGRASCLCRGGGLIADNYQQDVSSSAVFEDCVAAGALADEEDNEDIEVSPSAADGFTLWALFLCRMS